MPERAQAIAEVAQAIEHVGDAVDQLIADLRAARKETHSELTQIRRVGWLVLAALAVLAVMTIVGSYTLFLVNDTISPSGKRFKQNQERSSQVITMLVVDGDCRARRSAAGLPAPSPKAACASQTPPEVFPGTPPTSVPPGE